MTVLLGTVALEPNRWGRIDRARHATIDVADWLDGIAGAGFDGIELWEGHLDDAVLAGPLPVTIFNTYVSFDDGHDDARAAVAERIAASGCVGVKFNVGADPTHEAAYAARIAVWVEALPPTIRLLCECHADISITEDPVVAARVFAAAGPTDRVGAIVHTHESADHLRSRFDAYGDRIAHVHVNHLDPATYTAPRLTDVRAELEPKVALLRDLGFDGTWTIEFVHGVNTDDDLPARLLEQAAADLIVLREVLA